MGAIVLFDGVCNFCNGAVNWVIERDTADYFKFAALQSSAGAELTEQYSIDRLETDSVVLIENEKVYTYSTAALRIARKLNGIWSWTYIFIVIPKPVRDILYKLFAKYRYSLFGKREQCMLPTPELRSRFL